MSGSLLEEIWKSRNLILLLSFNEVKLRYRNSVLGFLWSFLEPLLMLSILYFVFTNIINTNIENYPIYLLLGLVIWYMFARSTTMGLSSLIEKSSILKATSLRKEIIVISSCVSSFIMMIFEFATLFVFMVAFHFIPPATIVFLPLLLIGLLLLTIGTSFVLSILVVYFRDVKFIWQVILQAGFFISPIFYKFEMFPQSIRPILLLNPMVPIIDTAHKIVLYGFLPTLKTTIFLIALTGIVFTIGYCIFKFKSKHITEYL